MTFPHSSNGTVTQNQHQKIMRALEKRLAKVSATIVRMKVRAEKDRQRTQAKLERERLKTQAKLDRQKRRDQAVIAKRVAKFEARKVRETKLREQKETTVWTRQIKAEEVRREKVIEKAYLSKVRKNFNRDNREHGIAAEEEARKWDREIAAEEEKRRREATPRLVSRAIRKNTEKWVMDGNGYRDPRVFLNNTIDQIERLINNTDSVGKKVSTVLVWRMIRSDPKTGEDTITIAHFRSKRHSIISEEDTTTEYSAMREKMLESLAEYQKLGSGWRLYGPEELEIFITKYKPLNGKSYKPLPKVISRKKAVINIENDDDQCFRWAITRALNPVSRDGERITKILRRQAEELDWEGVKFPTRVKEIGKFEGGNNVRVNVFSYDDEVRKIYTLRLGKTDADRCVNLFLYDGHYSVVNDIGRLVSSQISKKEHKKHICLRCLNAFGTLTLLNEHLEL